MNIQTKILANVLLATNVIKTLFRIVKKTHIGWKSYDFIVLNVVKILNKKMGAQSQVSNSKSRNQI